MSDLVARLRALVILDEMGSDNPLGREAADEIEQLRARVADLEDQLLQALGERPMRREAI